MTDTTETSSGDDSLPRDRRRNVPRAEARVILIDATIDLFRVTPFSEVTTRKISRAADINEFAIQRIFGSQLDLFAAVAKELSSRFAVRFAQLPADEVQPGALMDPDLVLRTRLIAWLVGSGADPDTLKIDPAMTLNQTLFERNLQSGDISSETARLYTQLVIYLAEGFITFNATHDTQPDDLMREAQLIAKFRDALPQFERELGWADNQN